MPSPAFDRSSARMHYLALPYQVSSLPLFEALAHLPWPVLLETRGDQAGRDMVAAQPLRTFTQACGTQSSDSSHDDWLENLRPWLEDHQADSGRLLGYAGYGEANTTLAGPSRMPLSAFGWYPCWIETDHLKQTTRLFFAPEARATAEQWLALLTNPRSPRREFQLLAPFASHTSAERFIHDIERIRAYLQAGDCYQVNYSRLFSSNYQGDPWQAYCLLREQCPAPFSGFMRTPHGALASLSPELFLQVQDKTVMTRPIKGTRPRLHDDTKDQMAGQALLHSEKDRAENLMIVDLLRNDLGKSCATGSVVTTALFDIEYFSHVIHMTSEVRGTLADDKNMLDLLQGAFPGGSITGAPKKRAMAIIAELEPHSRHAYCGSMGWLSAGDSCLNILIRSLVFEPNIHGDEGSVYCWAGAGIVMDSDPLQEYHETWDKVQGIIRALEQRLTQNSRHGNDSTDKYSVSNNGPETKSPPSY